MRAAFLPLSAAALALAGCVHERGKALVTVPAGAMAQGPAGPASVPPREREAFRRAADRSATLVSASVDGWDPLPPRGESADASVAALPREAPVKTSAAPRAHARLAPGASLEQRARETFLDAETTIDAESATVYLPPAYASEASLAGAAVTEDQAGRRTADGSAALTVRRLTVRARRVTLVIRSDGLADVQVTARGAVSLRSDQPASVVEETGLRSLFLRNDGYVPLR